MSLILSLLAIAGVVYLWRKSRKATGDGDLANRVKKLELAERLRTQHELENRS